MLISIITPAFNASKTISECYKSIFNQTYTEWEWIVVNDCSEDNTTDLLSEISRDDKRVVILNNEHNLGAAESRNVGISAAKGRFIAFIDSDDLWAPDKLEKQLHFMLKNNYAFTFSNYYLIFDNGKHEDYHVKKDCVTYKNILKSNVIGCSTVMYDTNEIGKQYMPLDSAKREDHAAWLDLIKITGRAYRIDESLAYYRVGNKSVSSNKLKMFRYQYRMYRNHEKFGVIKSFWYTIVISLNKVFKKYRY